MSAAQRAERRAELRAWLAGVGYGLALLVAGVLVLVAAAFVWDLTAAHTVAGYEAAGLASYADLCAAGYADACPLSEVLTRWGQK